VPSQSREGHPSYPYAQKKSRFNALLNVSA
ncbi:unnamed protein product, partial [marine sediment metagenome]